MTTAQLEHRLSQNAASPIFARLADDYLSQGKISEARALCISGLEVFPSYPTPYLILAKCLEVEGNFSAAREVIELAQKILPSLPLFNDLKLEYTSKLSPEEAARLAEMTIPVEVSPVESPVAEGENSVVDLPTESIQMESSVQADESANPFEPIPEVSINGLDLPETPSETTSETLAESIPDSTPEINSDIMAEVSSDLMSEVEPETMPEVTPDSRIEESHPSGEGGVGMSSFFESREHPRVEEATQTPSEPAPIAENSIAQDVASGDIVLEPPTAHAESSPEKQPVGESAPVAEMSVPVTPPATLEIEMKPLIPSAEDEGERDLSESASFEAGGRIVSRTLAEIYAIQGAYAEAILTFNLLMQERPEFRKECEERIRDLEAKMQSKPF